jgi:chromosome segregation ATPase
MPSWVCTAVAAAVRVENEFTSYELDAAHPWRRHEEEIKAKNAGKDAARRMEQLRGSVQPEEQPATVGGKAQSPELEGSLQLLLRELVRSDAECRRLSSACNGLREEAQQAATEHARRLHLVEEASAIRHAALAAELQALRRLASEAAASLNASRAEASAAVAEAGLSARRVSELQDVVRTLQPVAAAAATAAAQLAEARSKASALESLARRGAEDAVELFEVRGRIRGLERRTADGRAALERAEAELAGLREQTRVADILCAQLDLANGRADALQARAIAGDSAELLVARARVAALEARLESLSNGAPDMARTGGDSPRAGAEAVRAEVSVAEGGAVRLQLRFAADEVRKRKEGA